MQEMLRVRLWDDFSPFLLLPWQPLDWPSLVQLLWHRGGWLCQLDARVEVGLSVSKSPSDRPSV